MKKVLYSIILLILAAVDAHAVLKERDLAGTLVILRKDLTTIYQNNRHTSTYERSHTNALKNMYEFKRRSDQNALMLYSQKKEYVFDLAYACHEATELYKSFSENTQPFHTFVDKNTFDVARYDSLITTLQSMPDRVLDDDARENKAVCLALAINIHRQLLEQQAQVTEYKERFQLMDASLKNINDYANQRYNEIHQRIFQNGGSDYFSLLASLSSNIFDVKEAFNDKYKTYKDIHSEWDVKVIWFLFIIIFIYGLIASLLNIAVIRFLLPKRFRTEGFLARRKSIITATTVITFAIAISIIKEVYQQNFLAMAGNLLVQYSWLLGVIILSVLARLKPEQLKNAFMVYFPLILVSFIVIVFRIVLIPNALVNLIFPPIILVCALLQWFVLRKFKKDLPKRDILYAHISQTVFIFSTICSFIGFTLLAVQALIWWTIQLTCILTISCLRYWLKAHEEKKELKEKSITKVWFFYLINDAVVPVLGILSVMISIYWAADVFNLSDTVMHLFNYKLVNEEHFRVSLISVVMILGLWFVFSYISRLIIEIAKHNFATEDPDSAASRTVMIKNVVQVIVWGSWFMIGLMIMRVDTTWLGVIGAGLSTGVGFASKDIIENIYYGISLMTGRIKIGDLIECDGTRGRVASISYTSTLLEALDGSVIAFQNSQLFTLNYKNLTRNHGYVMSVLPFGVAYGSNAKEVIDLIANTIENAKIEGLNKEKPVAVILKELADSSVNFVLRCWVDVTTQPFTESEILSLIYNTLNEHNIEIPFPQQDVHIINSK